MSLVKLYIYNFESEERVEIDSQVAESFDDFVLVSVKNLGQTPQQIDQLHEQAKELFPDKQILIVDQDLDIRFFGFRETEIKELTDAS